MARGPVAAPGRLPPGAVAGSTAARQAVDGAEGGSGPFGGGGGGGELLLATANGVFGRTGTGGWAALDLNGTPAVTAAHSAAARELRGPSSVPVGSGGAGAVWPAIESFVRYDNARCMLYLTVRGGGGRGGVWRRRCAGLGAIIASEDPLAAAAAVPPREARACPGGTRGSCTSAERAS